MDEQKQIIPLTTKNSFYYIDNAVAERVLYKPSSVAIYDGNYEQYDRKKCLKEIIAKLK